MKKINFAIVFLFVFILSCPMLGTVRAANMIDVPEGTPTQLTFVSSAEKPAEVTQNDSEIILKSGPELANSAICYTESKKLTDNYFSFDITLDNLNVTAKSTFTIGLRTTLQTSQIWESTYGFYIIFDQKSFKYISLHGESYQSASAISGLVEKNCFDGKKHKLEISIDDTYKIVSISLDNDPTTSFIVRMKNDSVLLRKGVLTMISNVSQVKVEHILAISSEKVVEDDDVHTGIVVPDKKPTNATYSTRSVGTGNAIVAGETALLSSTSLTDTAYYYSTDHGMTDDYYEFSFKNSSEMAEGSTFVFGCRSASPTTQAWGVKKGIYLIMSKKYVTLLMLDGYDFNDTRAQKAYLSQSFFDGVEHFCQVQIDSEAGEIIVVFDKSPASKVVLQSTKQCKIAANGCVTYNVNNGVMEVINSQSIDSNSIIDKNDVFENKIYEVTGSTTYSSSGCKKSGKLSINGGDIPLIAVIGLGMILLLSKRRTI